MIQNSNLSNDDIQFIQTYKENILNGNIEYIINQTLTARYADICRHILLLPEPLSDIMVNVLYDCLVIANVVYNNTDLDDNEQLIDNELVYDKLVVLCNKYRPSPVGAPPVYFGESVHALLENNNDQVAEREEIVTLLPVGDDLYYEQELLGIRNYDIRDVQDEIVRYVPDLDISKQYRDTSHGSPELVGTLTKQKYVLLKQIEDLEDKDNITVFERDFLGQHIRQGIINPNGIIRLVLELKGDGVAVEGSIGPNSKLIRAVSRGDTENDRATDLTPKLYGYSFPRLPKGISLDCKFEAVMTYRDFYEFNKTRKHPYANCRSAIIGILGSNDGYKYMHYITLIPLKVAPSSVDPNAEPLPAMNRVEEIEFMNRYLRSDEILRYAYIEGTLPSVLFQVKKFVDEAELYRPLMPYLYDGVVVSYFDEDLVSKLGRKNSINQYQTAIKFDTRKAITKLNYCTFTVGQNGVITPMFHYEPVFFMGAMQTKSTGSSYDRFKDMDLHVGDIINLEYRHDVMTYVTKSMELDCNIKNATISPKIEFPTECPCCHSPIIIKDKGAYCTNLFCVERNTNRIANMFDKLGLNDLAEKTIEKIIRQLDVYNIPSFMNLSDAELATCFGRDADDFQYHPIEVFKHHMEVLSTYNYYDYEVVGALGFSSVGKAKWKIILSVYNVADIIKWYDIKDYDGMMNALCSLKGISKKTVDVLWDEMEFFLPDMNWIAKSYYQNIIQYKTVGSVDKPKIRFSGIRDAELSNRLNEYGFDADDNGSVTKDTVLLIVNSLASNSSKIMKAQKYGVPIMTIQEVYEIGMDELRKKIHQQ